MFQIQTQPVLGFADLAAYNFEYMPAPETISHSHVCPLPPRQEVLTEIIYRNAAPDMFSSACTSMFVTCIQYSNISSSNPIYTEAKFALDDPEPHATDDEDSDVSAVHSFFSISR
jgi:hypothetical protein